MIRKITNVDTALLVVRLIAGIILVMYGALKFGFLGGGMSLDTTLSPAGPGGGGIISLLVAIGELFGGLGIILGVLSRFSAAANILIQLGAILMVHLAKGFFASQGGFSYNLAVIGLLLVIVILGPGALSVLSSLRLNDRVANPRVRMALE